MNRYANISTVWCRRSKVRQVSKKFAFLITDVVRRGGDTKAALDTLWEADRLPDTVDFECRGVTRRGPLAMFAASDGPIWEIQKRLTWLLAESDPDVFLSTLSEGDDGVAFVYLTTISGNALQEIVRDDDLYDFAKYQIKGGHYSSWETVDYSEESHAMIELLAEAAYEDLRDEWPLLAKHVSSEKVEWGPSAILGLNPDSVLPGT